MLFSKLISSMCLSINLIIFFNNSPLFLGILLILLCILISILILHLYSSFMSLITIIIYIGGLLVLFSYFVALSYKHILSKKMYLMYFFSSMSLFFLMDFKINNLSLMIDESFCLTELIFSNTIIFILLVTMLFLILVVVVKISCSSFKGSLRSWM